MINTTKSKKIKLTEKQNKELCAMIKHDYNQDIDVSSKGMRTKLARFQEQTKGLLQKGKEKEDWQADLSLPITKSHKTAIAAKMFEAIHDSEQIVHFQPTSREDVEATEKKEKWFNGKLKNYTKNHERNLDRSINKVAQDGVVVFYTYYEREIKPNIEVETFELSPEDIADDQAFDIKVNSVVVQMYGAEANYRTIGEYKYEIKVKRKTMIDSNVKAKDDKEVLDFYPDTDNMVLYVDKHKMAVKYDGAQIAPLNLDDIYFDQNATDFQAARWVQLRFTENPFAIDFKFKEGVYDSLKQEDIDLIKKCKSDKESENDTPITDVVKDNQGIDEDSTGNEYISEIRARKCFYSYDISGTGKLEEIIVTYIPKINKIANVRHLHMIYPHGERPFTFSNYDIEDEESIWGIGIPESLESLQEGSDVSYNLWLDYSTLISTPMGKVKLGSSTQSNMEDKKIEIEPGTFVPVGEMDDLAFMQFPQNPNFALQDIALQGQFAEKVTGVSDATFGKQQSSRQPVGTTLKLIAEINIRTRVVLRRFLLGYKEALKQAYKLERAYAPKTQIFRQMGEDGEPLFLDITQEELRDLPDMAFNTSIDNINKEFLRQADILLFQQFMNPMMLQLGIVQPHNIYYMAKKLCLDYEIPYYHKMLTKPPNNPVEDQDIENMKMMQGEKIEVNVLDDDPDHLAKIEDFIEGSTEMDGVQVPNAALIELDRMPLFKTHILQHRTQLQRKEMAKIAAMNAAQKQGESMFPMQQPGGIQRPKTNPNMPPGGTPGTGG